MKAYGLEDMTYAKAFMRKVLESDVTDSKSFVGKLTDPRFMTFAKAFNFSTDGTVTTSSVAAQEAADENNTIGLLFRPAHQARDGGCEWCRVLPKQHRHGPVGR